MHRLGTSECSLWLKLEAQEKREVGLGGRESLGREHNPFISSLLL